MQSDYTGFIQHLYIYLYNIFIHLLHWIYTRCLFVLTSTIKGYLELRWF